MKATKFKLSVSLIATLAIGLSINSCRTTEANYRQAYEKAIAARDAEGEAELVLRQMPSSYIVDGKDTIAVVVENVSVLSDENKKPMKLKTFSVVVAKFHQRFNALSMRQRLVDMGYGDASVVTTARDGFYVVADSFEKAKDAQQLLMRIESNPPMTFSRDMPFILRDPRK